MYVMHHGLVAGNSQVIKGQMVRVGVKGMVLNTLHSTEQAATKCSSCAATEADPSRQPSSSSMSDCQQLIINNNRSENGHQPRNATQTRCMTSKMVSGNLCCLRHQ
jgi:hypothetical protein